MKKTIRIISCALAFSLLFALTACVSAPDAPDGDKSGGSAGPAKEDDGGTKPDSGKTPSGSAEEDVTEETGGSDTLVVFFSRTGEQYGVGVIEKGNTAIAAEMIADALGADLWEIKPEEDTYPTTYKELTDAAKQEQKENARPAYAGEAPDLSKYGTVFVGAPVWWGDWPMIMYTFFEENADALRGKRLAPFCTHEGSGLSGFDKKLASACPDSTVEQGLAVRGRDTQNNADEVAESVDGWLKELGLK